MLFAELRDMLRNFVETADYQKLLESRIPRARGVTDGEPPIIYPDPTDEDGARRLTLQHSAGTRISEHSFSGGNRVVIPSKNIPIDNSFETKLAKARVDFRFELNTEAGSRIHG